MQIKHIIFLIHPCCYEPLTPEVVYRDNLQLFVECEREIKARWIAVLAERPANTLLVQLGGPEILRDKAIAYLSESMVCYPQSAFPDDGDLAEYYRGLTANVTAHIFAHNLQFDPATATSELWGESFEGCVPGYGGAFAEYMGLQQSPKMRFEMTVYDSRFLSGICDWQVIQVADTDVEAWLFTCLDGTCAAMFQARRTAQWIDQRRVHLMLDDKRLQICTKQGHTIWPATPWEKGKTEAVLPYDMSLRECNWRWIRSVGMSASAFGEVIAAARITAEDS